MSGDVVVRPSVSLITTYDSNASLRGQSQNPTSDYVLTLSPQVNIRKEQKKFTLNGLYRATGNYYLTNPRLNTVSHFANAGMKMELSQNSRFEANDSFTYSKESLEATLTGIQTSRSSIMSNTINLNMAHDFTPRVSTTVNLSNQVLHFHSPTGVDSRTASAGVRGDFKMSPYTTLNTNYTFTNYLFKNPQAGKNIIGTHSLQAGVDSHLTQSLDFNLSGGATYTHEGNTRYDWIASAGLKKTFQSSSFNIGYSRATSNTSGLTDLLNISERYSLGWNYTLTSSFNIAASGNYSKNHTKPVAVVNLSSYDAGLSAGWSPYTWMTVSAGYTHFQQWDNASLGDDIRRERIYVNITAAPQEWRF